MSHIDQFESVFRSAIKSVYCYREIHYPKALLITDLADEESRNILSTVRQYQTLRVPQLHKKYAAEKTTDEIR